MASDVIMEKFVPGHMNASRVPFCSSSIKPDDLLHFGYIASTYLHYSCDFLDVSWNLSIHHVRPRYILSVSSPTMHVLTRPIEQKPTPENVTLFQGFEWNVPADQKHWQRLIGATPKLKAIGIDNIWLPPGCKAASPEGNGYDIYDLYDLGEFDQKGTKATKWGSKEELLELCKLAKDNGVGIYWDAVLNHKAGADRTERCRVVEVDNDDRNKEASEPYEIEGWLGFDFPGRGEKYSAMKYHWEHFGGTDFNQENEKKAIYKILGDNKGWSSSVDSEGGNADYMMFADIDYSHPEVQKDVKNWGVWITKELGLKGFRLDAVQHFSERFTNEWVENLREQCGDDIFVVGEFWTGDAELMSKWLDDMDHKFSLYDAPLLYNFSQISKTEGGDLRKVFDNSLVQKQPISAVTVVMNHDTQPGQTVATPIEGFFKPLAYSLILLRNTGYPCPFYGDLYTVLWRKARRYHSCAESLRIRRPGRLLGRPELHRLRSSRNMG
jgi:alpha-amylase